MRFTNTITPLSDTEYELISDAYEGSGGFLDGTYLTQYKRETDANYEIRKELSFYLNYVKVVVDSHIKAVFAKTPERDYAKNVLMDGFMLNADADGMSLTQWMKRAATKAKANGCVLVVVDNFDKVAPTIEDADKERQYPYVYSILPNRIVDVTKDKYGRRTSVTYTEDFVDAKGRTVTHYKTWDNMTCVTTDESEAVVGIVEHRIGILPCFFLYGSDITTDKVIPVPEFYQVARANKAIFNICSEIREIQRNQGFSILTIPGEKPTEGSTKVGTNNALYYPETSSKAPDYITPDSTPLDKLESFIDRLIQEIYRMSCITYTQQYATNQSGEAKKWTFHITAQVLEDFANNCQNSEMLIGKIFGKYINKDLNFTSEYNKQYGVDDIDVDLNSALLAMEVGLGCFGNTEMRKKLARSYFSEDGDDIISKVEAALDEELAKDILNEQADNNINNNTDENLDEFGNPIVDNNA